MARLIFTLVIVFLSACGQGDRPGGSTADHGAAGDKGETGVAFVNVDVVTMLSDEVLSGQTVVVRGKEIVTIGAATGVNVPAGYSVIDGNGLYLAPALADMHAHPMTQFDLDAYLANGVTLIRSMWGEPTILAMRDEVAADERRGPRIITGGRIVDGQPAIHYGSPEVLTAEDAKRVVHEQAAAGYDFIKIYSNLSIEAFDAIAAAAKADGIPFEGHVPNAVPASHAYASGMRANEHLLGIASETVAEDSGYTWRFDPAYPEFAGRLGSGELSLDIFDQEALAELAQQAAESGTWTVPTLVTLRGTALSPEEVIAESKRKAHRYLDYTTRQFWQWGAVSRAAWSADTYAGAKLRLEQDLRFVKAFHDAGARILAGTDAPNPHAYTGFGVVDELQLFSQAGLSNFEALQTATTAPAEYMGENGTAGVVTTGGRADLVLLAGNPLQDLDVYRDIEGVMVNGDWLDRAELDALLAGVARNSEQKAAVFAAAPELSTAEGEAIVFSAEFVRRKNGQFVGAERAAPIGMPGSYTAIVGQSLDRDGEAQNYRVEFDEQGQVRQLVVTGEDTASSTVEVENTAVPTLTGNVLDWLTLYPRVAGMQQGETLEIVAQQLDGNGELQPVTMTVSKHPKEVIVGHFYFTGSNRHDITVTSKSGSRSWRVWMGGGFYTGWPVKVELQNEDGDTVEYQRIL